MASPRTSLTPDFSRPPFAAAPESRFEPAPADGVLPEGFFSTSNLPTYVRMNGSWQMPARPRMDGAIVKRGPDLEVVEPTIAVGNMLPSFHTHRGTPEPLMTICVDQTEFVVSKLKDRGTHQAYGVVTNAQDFMHVLRSYVEQCRPS